MASYLTLVEQLSEAVDQLNQLLQGDESQTVIINNKEQPSVQKRTIDQVNSKLQFVLDAAADIDAVKYPNTYEGIQATSSGQFFSVVSDEESSYLDLFKNESGTAVFKKSYPSIDAVKKITEPSYKNYISGGDFIVGTPPLRKNSPVVELTTQESLISRGYSHAVSTIDTTEFAKSVRTDNLDGKYIVGAVLIFCENPSNFPSDLTVTVLSENDSNEVSSGSEARRLIVQLSDTLKLYITTIKVTQADARYILAGCNEVASDRFLAGFFASYSEYPVDLESVKNQCLLTDKIRSGLDISHLRSSLDITPLLRSDIGEEGIATSLAVRKYINYDNTRVLSKNLINLSTLLRGYFLDAQGVLLESASYSVTDFIPINAGDTYKLIIQPLPNTPIESANMRKSCFYDDQFNVVAGGSESNTDTILAPEGVSFVRITLYNTDIENGPVSSLYNKTLHGTLNYVDTYAYEFTPQKGSTVATKLHNAKVLSEGSQDDDVPSRKAVKQIATQISKQQALLGQPVFKNIHDFGDFIGGHPTIRNGGEVVDVTNTELNLWGVTHALRRGIDTNSFIKTTEDHNWRGKYITSCFILYVEDIELFNAVSTCDAFLFDSTNSSALIQPVNLLQESIPLTNNMRLVYRVDNALDVDSQGLIVGLINKTQAHVYMADFFTTVTDSYPDLGGIIDYYTTLAKSRASALKVKTKTEAIPQVHSHPMVGELTNQAKVIFAGEDSPTVIAGRKSTRIVKPFNNLTLFNSGVFIFDKDYAEGNLLKNAIGDDVPPVHANAASLLANHSYYGFKVTAPAHGLTNSDIGALYSLNGNDYVVVNVIDAETIAFMDTVNNTNTLPNSEELIYKSGGVKTDSITYTSSIYNQIYPAYKDYSLEVLVDGVPYTDTVGEIFYEKSLSFNETSYMLSREDIINWYISSGEDSLRPEGLAQLQQTTSYTFDIDGNCVITGNYITHNPFRMQDLMGLQAASWGDSLPFYYIPKTVSFDHQGTPINFSMIESYNVVSNVGQSVFFTSEKLDDSPISSDRWLQIGNDGVFAMGFLPLADAGVNRSANVTEYTAEIRGNTDKVYPRLLDVGSFDAQKGQNWNFVGYRIVHVPFEGATATYPVRTNGDDFYYIDYHNTDKIVSIPMPEDYVGREFEIVESRNITPLANILGTKLSCNVECNNDYGYLVLRVKS